MIGTPSERVRDSGYWASRCTPASHLKILCQSQGESGSTESSHQPRWCHRAPKNKDFLVWWLNNNFAQLTARSSTWHWSSPYSSQTAFTPLTLNNPVRFLRLSQFIDEEKAAQWDQVIHTTPTVSGRKEKLTPHFFRHQVQFSLKCGNFWEYKRNSRGKTCLAIFPKVDDEKGASQGTQGRDGR